MSVTTYATCGGLQNSLGQTMVYTPSEPLPWDYMVVESQNANGDPLIVDYFLGGSTGILQFTKTYTYDASNNVITLSIE